MNQVLTQALRVNQILVGALAAGVVLFAAFAIGFVLMTGPVMGEGGEGDMFGTLLLGIAGAVWVASLIAAPLMGNFMTAQMRKEWEASSEKDESKLPNQYSTVVIQRSALTEGLGLFAVVVFLLTGNWIALVIAALSVAGLGLVFPTTARFELFINRVTGQPLEAASTEGA